jgi:hypothetical protein
VSRWKVGWSLEGPTLVRTSVPTCYTLLGTCVTKLQTKAVSGWLSAQHTSVSAKGSIQLDQFVPRLPVLCKAIICDLNCNLNKMCFGQHLRLS